MKSFILLLGFFGLISVAAAEWTSIGQDEYVDYEYLDNKRSKNQLLKVWQLRDRQENIVNVAGTPALSIKYLTEIDCVRRESQIAYIVSYSEYMGKGKQLSAANPKAGWTPIIPDSLHDVFRKTGCPSSR